MKIANPLYDRAFKILMENERIAKLIISTIIEKDIISIELQPQETALVDKKRNFPILRYDFKAIIKTDEGKEKVVLIEVQKSKSPDPIIRFRKYLGSNYIKTQKDKKDDKDIEKALPIITIYFLGYKLKEYDTPAIIVNNCVYDATTKKRIDYKNEFVELLTHPSYILQVERLPEHRKTKLEKLLSLFDQAKKADEDYLLELSPKEIEQLDEFNILAKYLNEIIQDEQTIRELELEKEVEREFEKIEKLQENLSKMKDYTEKIEREKERIEQEKEQIAKEKQLAEQEKERIAKEKQLAEQEKERIAQEKQLAEQEKERAKQQEIEAKKKLAIKMKKYGEPIDVIMKETGLSKDDIEKL